MSGICGIVNFDGEPVDPDLLHRMAQAAAYRGPDGIHYHIDGNVGFAHLALHTTPESTREHQPMVNRRGDLILVADARIDNRADLIGTLTSEGSIQEKEPTDADLILAAYECWGEGCPRHLIGDFAFVIWDASCRTLYSARDPLGIRPLFYCKRGNSLIVASTISSVIATLGTTPALNDPLISDFLAWRFDRWVCETIYCDLVRVPAAHCLTATHESVRLSRYWKFGEQTVPSYGRDEDYVAHFLELFAESVRSRLRSVNPVGIAVSGGLDSSSIACLADKMVGQTCSGLRHPVRLYSSVFDEQEAANEIEYLNAVLSSCNNCLSTVTDGSELWGFKEIGSDGGAYFDEPEVFGLRCLHTAMMREARGDGCRVMLYGEGGDQVLGTDAYMAQSLLSSVPPNLLRAEARYFAEYRGASTARMVVSEMNRELKACIRPLVPARLLQKQQYNSFVASAPSWIDRRVLLPFDQSALDLTQEGYKHLRSGSAARVICQQLTSGWYTAVLGYKDSLAAAYGMEFRDPFLDRRLIEFQMNIPSHLRFGGGLTRLILREAMKEILPEIVRQRRGKAHFSERLDRGLRHKEKHKVDILLQSVAEKFEQIDVSKLQMFWQQYCEGSDLPSLGALAPLYLGAWVRSKNGSQLTQ